MMNSASPSQQLSAFGQGIYGQPTSIMQQRGFPPTQSQPVQSSQQQQQPSQPQTVPPSSITSGGAQSPSRSLFGNLGAQRGILPNIAANLSQIKRPNPLASGILSSSTGTPTLGNFGRQLDSVLRLVVNGIGDNMVPNFDLSQDFPTLGNRGGLQQAGGAQNVRNYAVGVMSTKQQESTQEFQIQQEDFPALPKPNSGQAGSTDNARKTPPSILTLGSSYDNSMKDGKLLGEKLSANGQRKGIQTMPDGTVTNIPQGMVTDQFGMVGLLTFIRAAETDPNLVALAPGIDLTTLGLNLNSPENLYSTFQSPWADSPCRPQDIDFHVPSEYLTNIFIREKLAPFKLNRYGENLLFFLFYMNGGDVLQLAAAAELYNRDWRYHKEERVWITRATGMEPEMKTNTYERGTYYFFDAQNWRKVMKQFHLEYDRLEERPQLPVEVLMNLPNTVSSGPH